jgi:hypothetical protein
MWKTGKQELRRMGRVVNLELRKSGTGTEVS